MAERKNCWKTQKPCEPGCDTANGGVCPNLRREPPERTGLAMPTRDGLARGERGLFEGTVRK